MAMLEETINRFSHSASNASPNEAVAVEDNDDDGCEEFEVWPGKNGATSVGITVFIPPMPNWPRKKDLKP